MRIEFQSRNRGTFGFKHGCTSDQNQFRVFQSRNRGTFGFKWITYGQDQELYIGFNLGIEVLLVSS